jgi:hypothetical protein
MSYCSDDGSSKLLSNFDQYLSGYTPQRSTAIFKALKTTTYWYLLSPIRPVSLCQIANKVFTVQNHKIMEKPRFLNFIHNLWCSKKTQHFQNGIYFRQVQWLRLVLSNGPSRVGAHIISTDDETRSISRNIVFLEHQTTDKVQKPSFSKYNMPSSEPFRIHKIRVRIYGKQYKSWALPL